MDSIAVSTLLIAIVIGVSCGLMGVFLVLRKMSMMIDAIAHSILLGIVLSYMAVGDLSSPWIMVGSTLMGVVTVYLIELLVKTNRTTEDAATGTVFPFLFSIAVILITTRYRHTHLDSHAISGNLEFAAFEPLVLFGVELGSKTLFISVLVLILLVTIIVLFYKEIKLAIFDSAFAKTLKMAPMFIHYMLMTMVSLTAVTSFNAVGSILVIAMMIGPAASALLISKDLKIALIASSGIAIFNSIAGYFIAMVLFNGQVNIASTIATVTFITFLLIWTFEPKKGLITSLRRQSIQRYDIKNIALFTHIINHEDDVSFQDLQKQLNWDSRNFNKHMKSEFKKETIIEENGMISITKLGRLNYEKLLEMYT